MWSQIFYKKHGKNEYQLKVSWKIYLENVGRVWVISQENS